MPSRLSEREMHSRSSSSDPCSCLTWFFLNFAPHIPWLPSLCNDQIPSHTTTSTSHSGAIPTHSPAEDDIAIDIDAGDIDARTIRTSNAHGSRSTMAAGSSQTRTFDLSQSGPAHLIAKMFPGQELSKVVLEFAVSMTMGLLISQHQGLTYLQASTIVLALSIGFVTLWNGMLLHDIHQGIASSLVYTGMGTILIAYFGLVSSFLPATLVWAGWLCCGLSCLPFLLRHVLRWRRAASSTEQLPV